MSSRSAETTPRQLAAIRARIAADKLRQVALAIESNRPDLDRIAVAFAIEANKEIQAVVNIIHKPEGQK